MMEHRKKFDIFTRLNTIAYTNVTDGQTPAESYYRAVNGFLFVNDNHRVESKQDTLYSCR